VNPRPCECTALTGEARHDCPDCGGEGIRTKARAEGCYVVLVEGGRLSARELEALEEYVQTHRIRPGNFSFAGRKLRIERSGSTAADEVWLLPVDLGHPLLRRAIPDELRAPRCRICGALAPCPRHP
jgi:hypothetical protein